MLTTHNIDIQAMLVWLTLPFYDFCGFRSVAVNSVYKLQFFLHLSNTINYKLGVCATPRDTATQRIRCERPLRP